MVDIEVFPSLEEAIMEQERRAGLQQQRAASAHASGERREHLREDERQRVAKLAEERQKKEAYRNSLAEKLFEDGGRVAVAALARHVRRDTIFGLPFFIKRGWLVDVNRIMSVHTSGQSSASWHGETIPEYKYKVLQLTATFLTTQGLLWKPTALDLTGADTKNWPGDKTYVKLHSHRMQKIIPENRDEFVRYQRQLARFAVEHSLDID